jgi:hypothetical protein
MTAQQQAKVDELTKKYTDAKALYDIEFRENTVGHANAQSHIWQFPNGQNVDQQAFTEWINGSDASLTWKKAAMESAKKDLDEYLAQLDKAAMNEFATQNPQLYTDYLKNKDNQAAAAAEAEGKLFAQKSTWWIIGGIVFSVVMIGVVYFYKKYVKKA